MNLIELDHALRRLRLSGMADVLEARLRQAQTEKMVPLDIVSILVSDELQRRQDRLFERRIKLARFRDPDRALASFDFEFNRKMNRSLVYELATSRFVSQREDALFLGPPGTGKSHLAQAIGRAAIQQGYRVAEFPVSWTCDRDSRLKVRSHAIQVITDLLAIRRLSRRFPTRN